ncbi:hypothetical protein [Bdellovibrio sp. BCCA]|uniref:hypothetical protein n=1 Tax=Bdellovibrio sp. BCCA TaxID=3136281 RepID=UPI0030F1C5BC
MRAYGLFRKQVNDNGKGNDHGRESKKRARQHGKKLCAGHSLSIPDWIGGFSQFARGSLRTVE